MEALLRRYLWAVDLVAIVLGAVLTAHATATMAEAALLRQLIDVPLRVDDPVVVRSPPAPDSRVDTIVARNIFCSTCRRPALRAEPSVAKDAPTRTRLPLALLAVMYAAPPADPRWSVAIIREGADPARPYLVDAKLGEGTIDEIDEVRVFLRFAGGRREYLDLLEGTSVATAITAPSAADPVTAELDAGITRTGAHSFAIRRATLESMLGKMDTLAPAARIVPEVRQGETVGVRLAEVREGGPFAKIGLLPGDVVSSINGLATTSPTNSLAIYTNLRSSGHLSVALERNGRSVTEEYDVR